MTGSASPVQIHAQIHAHAHVHRAGGDHGHGHDPALPHPPQPAPWSILRLSVAARLAGAFGASAVLWAIVWIAMRPV